MHEQLEPDPLRGSTPAYVYDIDGIREVAGRVAARLSGTNVYYALKANPLPAITRALLQIGLGVEVASRGELDIAMHSGAAPEQIIFGGPAKSRDDIDHAVGLGLKALHCESVEELDYAAHMRDSHGSPTLTIARINPDWDTSDTIENMTGRSSQFGIDSDVLTRHIRANRESVDGIHMYQASQVRDWLDVARSIQELDRYIQCLGDVWSPSYVNYGGGFGIPLMDSQREFDFEAFSHWWVGRPRSSWQSALELGRYLVGPYGQLVVEVRSVKCSRGVTYIITDGGLNAFIRPQLTGENHRVRRRVETARGRDMAAIVTGPLCTPLDVLGPYEGPPVGAGDLLVIEDAGAYGPTMSPAHFLGHPTPSEWAIEGGSMRLVRASRQAVSYSRDGLI